MNKPPIVKGWDCETNSHGKSWMGDVWWRESSIIAAAKNLKPFEIPLAAIPTNYQPWDLNDFHEIAYHVNRVYTVDRSFPVILDIHGSVIDGHHRIMRSLIEGDRFIMAVRLEEMPPIDGKKE